MAKARGITDETQMKYLIRQASAVGIGINILLVIFKLICGIIAHSGAMISDAIHSASDVLATFMAMVGVNLSQKAPDKEHPYGHERLECVASVLLSGVLLASGSGIGYHGLRIIVDGNHGDLTIPGIEALIAAVVSIIVKEWMYHYTKHIARKMDSAAFLADAWHHRSDALSSIGALVGIWFARIGYPVMDPVASVIICGFIVKVSYDIFRESMARMVDRACDTEFEKAIEALILRQNGVLGIDTLRTRLFGNRIYVDVELLADGSDTLSHAHQIAEQVHETIEQSYPEIKHVMIHVNPQK